MINQGETFCDQDLRDIGMKRGGFREECGGAEGAVGKEPDSPLSHGFHLAPVGYWLLGDKNLVKMFCYPNFVLLLRKTAVKVGLFENGVTNHSLSRTFPAFILKARSLRKPFSGWSP